jgi:hypothetical protein
VLPLEFQLETLLESAREELATAKPEQFKIFLLDAMAGLRRNEIDNLPWSALRFDEGVIHIQATEYVAVIGPVVHEVSDEFDPLLESLGFDSNCGSLAANHDARGVRREACYVHRVQHDGGAFCLCGKSA